MTTRFSSCLAGLTLALAILGGATGMTGCASQKEHQKIARAGQELRFDLAQLYVDKGAREQAIPLLRRMLAEKPGDIRVRILYGTVLRDLGLYPQARAQLEMALQAQPKSAAAHAALGILYDLQREFARAQKYHRRAVALAPGRADYFNNLGFSYYLSGRISDAVQMYQQALALDPGLALAYNNLGFAYGRMGKLDRAERTFRTALGEAGALYNMALVCEARGEHDKAESYRQRAFSRDPELRAYFLSDSKSSDSKPNDSNGAAAVP